jgi:hypothetical protein
MGGIEGRANKSCTMPDLCPEISNRLKVSRECDDTVDY